MKLCPYPGGKAGTNIYFIMSKGNMLLGFARGKVGSLVFSRANGKQITRARSEVVRNPQTTAQMIQRIILQSAVQAYSKMQAIVDHSYEGINPGQDSMSFFMKSAANALRSKLAEVGDLDAGVPCFVPLGMQGLAVNAFTIAKGTCPKVIPQQVTNAQALVPANANTYAGVINGMGLQRGDQLTVCALVGTTLETMSFRYARIILDPKNGNGTDADLSSVFISDGAIAFANPKNENHGLAVEFDGSTGFLRFEPTGVDSFAAVGVIISRKTEDGSWKRSDSQLVIADGVSIGYSMQQCLDIWAEGGIDTTNPRYLNNASAQGGRSSSGTAPTPTPGSNKLLTITTTGQGSAVVKVANAPITSGASVAISAEVTVEVTPASGQVPSARINNVVVALTANQGVYSGTFAMPNSDSTLSIDTGNNSGQGGDDY